MLTQADNYDTLATKATQYSARLLKKPDQCRAVAKASYLFVYSTAHTERDALEVARTLVTDTDGVCEAGENDGAAAASQGGPEGSSAVGREPKRVLECLQRSLKIADACKVRAWTSRPSYAMALNLNIMCAYCMVYR